MSVRIICTADGVELPARERNAVLRAVEIIRMTGDHESLDVLRAEAQELARNVARWLEHYTPGARSAKGGEQ